MHSQKTFLLVVTLMSFLNLTLGQGSLAFRNLDFEEANLPYLPPGQSGGLVAVSNALPGWTAYFDTSAQTEVLYNNQALDYASISILSSNYASGPLGFGSGSYYAFLKGGGFTGGSLITPALTQTGQIPASANSLRLTAYSAPYVTFLGNHIPLVALSSSGFNTIYGGDISGFAGMIGELRFTSGFSYLDNILFSTQQIPEPSAFSLVGAGILLFARRSRLVARS